ncbi:MAG TPA: isoprenylcysteine carboxylmethyltransferase family protein [Steroidobacteraceae bacterium]|nr:isoprenylcysteine carboxylmethyltransferase family protein [Steroidobacteraceae bacterium]
MHHDLLLARRVIVGLWAAWALYWAVTALNAKSTQRRESPASRAAHVIPLLVGGLLIGWHSVTWPALAARLWPRSFAIYCLGVVLLAAGLGFAVWARMHLGRNWSGTVTIKEGHELIRSGPYALVRHPIYTGILAALLGTAIASGTVHAALGFFVIAVALLRKMRIEEAFLSETFPDEYPRYRAQLPALIPFTRPRQSAPR